MCGICGVVDAVNVDLADCLAPMLKRLEHRGPDNEGVLKMDYCAFGHRRFAIIDLSERGHQPMLSADGQVMVVFNGEIYNHKELRSILEARVLNFVRVPIRKYCYMVIATGGTNSCTTSRACLHLPFGMRAVVACWLPAIPWERNPSPGFTMVGGCFLPVK